MDWRLYYSGHACRACIIRLDLHKQSLMCVVWLDGSVHVNSSRLKCRFLIVYAPTDCRFPEACIGGYLDYSDECF